VRKPRQYSSAWFVVFSIIGLLGRKGCGIAFGLILVAGLGFLLIVAVMPDKIARDIFPKTELLRLPKPQSDLIDLSDGNNRNRS
jgi:hypothetical protein